MRTHFWILILSFTLLSGCSWFSDKDETLKWSARKLYTEATEAMSSGNYGRAVKMYQKLESRYPFGRYAMQSQLNVAYVHYKKGEAESALAAIERFEKLYPDHYAIAYALYLKGLIKFEQNMGFFSRWLPTDASQRDPGSTHESYNDFAELIRRFPDSEYAHDGRMRMFYLRNNLAKHELHVARYYMDRGAYLAAVNRAQYVVEKYQYTPSVKEALDIMIVAYDKLGMPKLQQDTMRVLALNEANGVLTEGDDAETLDPTLMERIWEYLELDKN